MIIAECVRASVRVRTWVRVVVCGGCGVGHANPLQTSIMFLSSPAEIRGVRCFVCLSVRVACAHRRTTCQHSGCVCAVCAVNVLSVLVVSPSERSYFTTRKANHSINSNPIQNKLVVVVRVHVWQISFQKKNT